MQTMFTLENYCYNLPPHLIAQQLTSPADNCRLMIVQDGSISHHTFTDIINHLGSGDLLIFNDSKVVPARIIMKPQDNIITNKNKQVAYKIGEAEIFFLRQYNDNTFEALVRRGKWFKKGSTIHIGDYVLTIGETTQAGRMITVSNIQHSNNGQISNIVMQFLHDHGTIPLPPYIADDPDKYNEYQPIIARQEGSVAAPTAALHFTDRLLQQLHNTGIQRTQVTLHIGIGTFRLIEVDDVRNHEIHREVCQIYTELFNQIAHTHQSNKSITIVGTTSCRTIESLPYLYLHIRDQIILDDNTRAYRENLTSNLNDPGYIIHPLVMGNQIQFETQLYMYPGFTPKIIDHLITNFHLPQSTLLLMIASLIGYDLLMQCYALAIQYEYQFYSFGDAMLLKDLK